MDIILLIVPIYIVYRLVKAFREKVRQTDQMVVDYEESQDKALRDAGHSEEYVAKMKRIRALRLAYKENHIGVIFAWIGGGLCLFLFPPIGIPLTIFAVIASFNEGRKMNERKKELVDRILAIRESLPEI
jgi:hypothetical protein